MFLVDAVRHRRTDPLRAAPAREHTPAGDPADVAEIKTHHHRGRKVVTGVLLAATVLGGGAAIAPAVFAPVGTAISSVIPSSVKSTVNTFVGSNPQDPSSAYGSLYIVNTNGTHQVLDTRGQTTPDGHDIPSSAVVGNRVIIMAEGIGDQVDSYAHDTHAMLQTQGPGTFNVNQPVLGVHEGTMVNVGDEVLRSTKDITYTKIFENGGSVSNQTVYTNDPAVQTLHNVIQQQLDAGHDILLIPHSGGSPEDSLALNMLVHQNPAYKGLIAQHVRVLDLAGASAPQDFEDAGVQANNIYFTADHVDPIGTFGATYIDPSNPASVVSAVSHLVQNFGQPTDHTNKQIFAINTLPDGHNLMENFVEGGAGGTFIR